MSLVVFCECLSYRTAVGCIFIKEYDLYFFSCVTGKKHTVAFFAAELCGGKICNEYNFLSDKLLGSVVFGLSLIHI